MPLLISLVVLVVALIVAAWLRSKAMRDALSSSPEAKDRIE
jgi:septation ring formation regulator EzrA